MRIDVLTSLYPGVPKPFEGVFAEERWARMVARGHAVRVVQPLPRTPGPLARGAWADIRRMPARESRRGVEVERPRYLHLPGRARRNAKRFAAVGVARILDGGRPDVVVCDYAWPAAVAAHALRDAGLPCVVNGRGSDVLQVAGEAGLGDELASALRAAGWWCAVSRDLVDAMDGVAGEPGRGVLVPNGVDLERFTLRDRAAAMRAVDVPPDRTRVLVVGHLIERKDPLLALEAFAEGAAPNADCVFLGRGPLHDAVLARARELGVADRVRLLGEVAPDRLADWYAASDVLLLTSRREGRPNVVLEALASGCPVVATASGGTGELLEAWGDRALVAERDPIVIGERLRRMMEGPPEREALRASVAHLSWDASLDVLERLLERAASGEEARR